MPSRPCRPCLWDHMPSRWPSEFNAADLTHSGTRAAVFCQGAQLCAMTWSYRGSAKHGAQDLGSQQAPRSFGVCARGRCGFCLRCIQRDIDRSCRALISPGVPPAATHKLSPLGVYAIWFTCACQYLSLPCVWSQYRCQLPPRSDSSTSLAWSGHLASILCRHDLVRIPLPVTQTLHRNLHLKDLKDPRSLKPGLASGSCHPSESSGSEGRSGHCLSITSFLQVAASYLLLGSPRLLRAMFFESGDQQRCRKSSPYISQQLAAGPAATGSGAGGNEEPQQRKPVRLARSRIEGAVFFRSTSNTELPY